MATSSSGPSSSIELSSPYSSESSDCDSSTQSDVESADAVPTPASPVVSLLDRLRAPTTSELSRKRKVLSNPPKGKKRSSGSCGLKTKVNVHPSVRVSEFPGEELSVSMGKLFCKACREQLSVKQSSVKSHIKSVKHVNGKAKIKD